MGRARFIYGADNVPGEHGFDPMGFLPKFCDTPEKMMKMKTADQALPHLHDRHHGLLVPAHDHRRGLAAVVNIVASRPTVCSVRQCVPPRSLLACSPGCPYSSRV